MPASPRDILAQTTTIAVVGASTDPSKPSGAIPRELQRHGFRIIPVHPSATRLFDEPVYRTLADIPERVDLVNVFRPSAEAPGLARQAVAIGAKALWLQSGIVSDEAREIAEAAGLAYVEDRCIWVERARHGITKTP